MDVSNHILIAGAGKIGCTLATIFASQTDYPVVLVDKKINNIPKAVQENPAIEIQECDVQDALSLLELIKAKSINTIISSLPYFCNLMVAEVAKANNCHYFDLTEDVRTTHDIFEMAKDANTAFAPQCGVAPGLVNIIASDFIRQCDSVTHAKVYCGALPQESESHNALRYALTWSTDGLINEYGNRCRVLENGQPNIVNGLSHNETLNVDDKTFEAFHTSGGIGTMIETYRDKVENMFYKCLRYPGHCEKMQFLMYDLKLNEDRDTLKKILENAIPSTKNDIVITHVDVLGVKNNKVQSFADTRYFYPTQRFGDQHTAIQAVTALSAALVIDTVISNPKDYHGPIKQEDFDFEVLLNNPMSEYLTTGK